MPFHCIFHCWSRPLERLFESPTIPLDKSKIDQQNVKEITQKHSSTRLHASPKLKSSDYHYWLIATISPMSAILEIPFLCQCSLGYQCNHNLTIIAIFWYPSITNSLCSILLTAISRVPLNIKLNTF